MPKFLILLRASRMDHNLKYQTENIIFEPAVCTHQNERLRKITICRKVVDLSGQIPRRITF